MTTPNIEELIARLGALANTEANELADALNEAADLLQSQAKRIKVLEGQLDDATAAARSDQMIAETAQAAASRLLTERDNLRAQLNAIAATEPVASHYFDIEGNLYTANRAKFLRPSLNGLTPLFTRPMPAESKDAERYRWLAGYLISMDTSKDDYIVSCASVDEMSALIDAQKGAK